MLMMAQVVDKEIVKLDEEGWTMRKFKTNARLSNILIMHFMQQMSTFTNQTAVLKIWQNVSTTVVSTSFTATRKSCVLSYKYLHHEHKE